MQVFVPGSAADCLSGSRAPVKEAKESEASDACVSFSVYFLVHCWLGALIWRRSLSSSLCVMDERDLLEDQRLLSNTRLNVINPLQETFSSSNLSRL